MIKNIVKKLVAYTPYTVSKGPQNRFQAIDEVISTAAARGYAPRTIVDGGANVGDFSATMLKIFPDARIHAVEPQPGCRNALEELAGAADGRMTVHPFALCAPADDGGELRLAATDSSTTTGAHIWEDSSAEGISVRSATLDTIMAGRFEPTDRVMLKLDLQGYELAALQGAQRLLEATELVLTEVSFFAQAYEPPIAELIAFFDRSGFELHDIGSLSARRRDNRAKQGDFLFARKGSPLVLDTAWA